MRAAAGHIPLRGNIETKSLVQANIAVGCRFEINWQAVGFGAFYAGAYGHPAPTLALHLRQYPGKTKVMMASGGVMRGHRFAHGIAASNR